MGRQGSRRRGKAGIFLLVLAGLLILGLPAGIRAESTECPNNSVDGTHMWLTQMLEIVYPTCTDQGIVPQKCEYCGAMKYSYMPANGHDYHVTGNSAPATCTTDGWVEYKCNSCGDTYKDTIPAFGHTWTMVNSIAPSCDTDGSTRYQCTTCGTEYTDVLPKTGHQWQIVEENCEAPTCQNEGFYFYRCLACGAEMKTILPKSDHMFMTYKTEKGDCQHKGVQYQKCGVCDLENKVDLGYGEHKYGSWYIKVAATDHSSGVRARNCSVCGREETESFYPDGTLARGSQGSAVADLQSKLIDLHYLNDRADGAFGKNTENAVKAFQTANGLSADGIAWPQTITAVNDAWAKEKNPASQPTPTPEQPALPPIERTSCRHTLDAETASHTDFCKDHWALLEKIAEASSNGTVSPELLSEAIPAWEDSLNSLYEKWTSITQYDTEVYKAKEAFYHALELQDHAMAGLGEQAVKEWRLQALIDETTRLCALLNE